MRKIKQALKLLALICLIVLAGIGIGLSGGVPLPTRARRNSEKENIELPVSEDSNTDKKQYQVKE